MNIAIRPLCSDDIPAVHSIQRQNPAAAQWKAADYRALSDPPGDLALVATAKGEPSRALGFVVFRQVADEAELLNLAVAPPQQRQGIARTLIDEGIGRLIQAEVRCLFLEVRASNQPALTFYRSVGFERRAIRKQYYQNPAEDAEVLWLEIGVA